MSVSDPAALHRPASSAASRSRFDRSSHLWALAMYAIDSHISAMYSATASRGNCEVPRAIWSIRRLRRGDRPIQARRSFRSLEGIRRRSRRAADVGKFRQSLLPPALERNTATAASRQSGLHPDGDTNPTRQLLHEAFYINATKNCTNAGGRLFFFVIRIATSGLTRGDPSHMFRATLSSHLH